MILSVLGASGASGQYFVRQALEAGHFVRALVRSPEKLDPSFQSHENFSIFAEYHMERVYSSPDSHRHIITSVLRFVIFKPNSSTFTGNHTLNSISISDRHKFKGPPWIDIPSQ